MCSPMVPAYGSGSRAVLTAVTAKAVVSYPPGCFGEDHQSIKWGMFPSNDCAERFYDLLLCLLLLFAEIKFCVVPLCTATRS